MIYEHEAHRISDLIVGYIDAPPHIKLAIESAARFIVNNCKSERPSLEWRCGVSPEFARAHDILASAYMVVSKSHEVACEAEALRTGGGACRAGREPC